MSEHNLTNKATAQAEQLSSKFVPSIKNRIAGLDELRGIAILLVLLSHSIFLWEPWGARFDFVGTLGVNIFFIISGYLIYTILTKERRSPHFFRTFYVRRIFRIWPLFLVITGFGLLAAIFLKQPVKDALPYYLTFTMNFAVERGAGWLLPFTSPMWSLAIEEQFYLFLPLLVRQLNPKRMPVLIAILCAASAVSSLLVLHWMSEGNAAFAYPNFKNTALRIHYIGFGVLLASQPRWAYVPILTWLGTSILFLHFAGIMEIVIAILLVSLIDHTIQKGPLIRNRVLARFGFLCYGLYLIHWPIVRLIQKGLLPHLGKLTISQVVTCVVFIGVSFLVAHLSFEYFENPIQKLRTRFEQPRS
jgi:peptidoglycan/LPS O-acetylase OafA/YrhL